MKSIDQDKTAESGSARLSGIRKALLIITVAAQFVTVLITWDLWQVRTMPPNLPVGPLPQFPFAWLMLVSLVGVLFVPRTGILIHFAVLLAASLCDQMRLQPQFLANFVLLLAVADQRATPFVRWFLVSLWLWAGIHKLVSPDWCTFGGQNMAEAIGLDGDSTYFQVAIAVALTEIGVGLLAWLKPKWGAVACVVLHLGIVIYLSPLISDWNFSVIPWNLATAVTGAWILWNAENVIPAGPYLKLAFVILLILPALFYAGWMDHGYSHVLYSHNLPRGLITRNDGSVIEIEGWGSLAVPFPNERRLLRQYFELTAEPGEKLHLLDPRPWLDNEYRMKLPTGDKLISREEFLSASENVPAGVELDSERIIFKLAQAKVRMLRREAGAMVYAVEFPPTTYRPDLLAELRGIPNVEQIQLQNTGVTDDDLDLLKDLPRVVGIGLNNTGVTDEGVAKLEAFPALRYIECDATAVSDEAMARFYESRNPEGR